jgi:hypothetical protein
MKPRIAPIAVLAIAPVLLVLILAVAVKAGAGGAAKEGEGFTLMSAAELASILGQKDVRVFDANSAETFAKGHVPGAVFLEEYRKFPASVLPADKATRVIFYCKNTH